MRFIVYQEISGHVLDSSCDKQIALKKAESAAFTSACPVLVREAQSPRWLLRIEPVPAEIVHQRIEKALDQSLDLMLALRGGI